MGVSELAVAPGAKVRVTGEEPPRYAFVDLMRSLGEIEVARTGVSAISRGNNIDLEAK